MRCLDFYTLLKLCFIVILSWALLAQEGNLVSLAVQVHAGKTSQNTLSRNKTAHCLRGGILQHSDRQKMAMKSEDSAEAACPSSGLAIAGSPKRADFFCVCAHLISSRDSHSVLAFRWLLVFFTKHCNTMTPAHHPPPPPLLPLQFTAYHDCHIFSQGTLISSHPQDMICVSDPNQNKLAVKPLDSLCL